MHLLGIMQMLDQAALEAALAGVAHYIIHPESIANIDDSNYAQPESNGSYNLDWLAMPPFHFTAFAVALCSIRCTAEKWGSVVS